VPEAVIHYTTEEKKTKPYEKALSLISKSEGNRPTAFVCYNDELAVHILEAVRQAGLTVPEDVSIVGFDDSFWATATEVKLTTLTHPKTDLGTRAADMLIDRIEGKEAAADEYIFEPELVIRESTRKL
jgi:GntR family transcriptional regulator of arabinose operon